MKLSAIAKTQKFFRDRDDVAEHGARIPINT
jgi:hypothetical protein